MPRTRPPYPANVRSEALRLLRSGARTPRHWRRSWAVPSRRFVTGSARTRRIVGRRPTPERPEACRFVRRRT